MGRAVAPIDERQTSRGVRNKDMPENIDPRIEGETSPTTSLMSSSSSIPPPQSLAVSDGGFSSTDDDAAQPDDRDEEEAEDSSLGYSDDSASLSDVYFLPGDDLARPGTYRDPDPYIYSSGSSMGSSVIGTSALYGSISTSRGAFSSNGLDSPLWIGGSIQEDMEAIHPEDAALLFSSVGSELRLMKGSTNHVSGMPLTNKERSKRQRKQKRQMQKIQKRLKEQAARERAVSRVRGQPQEVTQWQDAIWACLFLIQLVTVVLIALRFGFGVISFKEYKNLFWDQRGGRMLSESVVESTEIAKNASLSDILFNIPEAPPSTHDTSAANTSTGVDSSLFTIDYKNVLALTFFTGLYACVLAYLSFGFMLIISRSLIQIMLIISIVVSLGWGLIGLSLDPYGLIADMGFGAFLVTLGYTMFSWNRIPFSATNLYTALCAMRCTADITILGLMSLVVAFGWCLLWCTAFVGVVNSFNNSDCDKNDKCSAHVSEGHIPILLLFLFSFHWTTMVIKNVVRVTVASAIGTWWFQPSEIGPFCTTAVIRPFLRSMTKSFGSICLGSLIVQPAQIVLNIGTGCCYVFGSSESQCLHPQVHAEEEKQPLLVVDNATQKETVDSTNGANSTGTKSGDSSAGGAQLENGDSAMESVGLFRRCCGCFSPLHRFIRSSNRWSYTYIGMYGYSFTNAGEKALQLFQTRQWLEVVEDSLIQNVLLMASLVIGGSSGVFAVVVEETDGYDFTSFHQPIISAFVIGTVLGYVLSNILLLGVVGSAVNTVLICFAAGPFEFDKNHPRLSREMREVWSQQVWEPPV
eukprot:scaffold8210_cov175-Amphora_coffeaeformis.AAC.2